MERCPLNNIRLENGKPVWGKHCTHCMACICDCPKEAIEYIEKLNHQYIDLLNGDGLASDKFWGLNRRVRIEKVWVFRWNFVKRICRIRWSICCMRKLSRKMT